MSYDTWRILILARNILFYLLYELFRIDVQYTYILFRPILLLISLSDREIFVIFYQRIFLPSLVSPAERQPTVIHGIPSYTGLLWVIRLFFSINQSIHAFTRLCVEIVNKAYRNRSTLTYNILLTSLVLYLVLADLILILNHKICRKGELGDDFGCFLSVLFW